MRTIYSSMRTHICSSPAQTRASTAAVCTSRLIPSCCTYIDTCIALHLLRHVSVLPVLLLLLLLLLLLRSGV